MEQYSEKIYEILDSLLSIRVDIENLREDRFISGNAPEELRQRSLLESVSHINNAQQKVDEAMMWLKQEVDSVLDK